MPLRRFALLVSLTAPLALAQPQPPAPQPAEAQSLFSLTIYSNADPALFDPQEYMQAQLGQAYNNGVKLPGYGVIRETRRIDLQAGLNTVRFTDVAADIDPTTVQFKSLTAPDSTTVLEQDYGYDLFSPDKLLTKYIGHDIIINRKQEPLKDDRSRAPETIQGKLLSYDGNYFVLQTDNKRLPVQVISRNQDLSEIKLFDLQTGLITKPTLIWKVSTDKAGAHDAQVTYQTNQITWRADYSLLLNPDETAADLGAWVTIVNQSGASYPGAKLKLVAGDIHRLRPPEEGYAKRPAGGLFGNAGKPEFEEKSFFEYHLYTLSRPTSIADNSSKQIELFPRKLNIPVKKSYRYHFAADNIRRGGDLNNLDQAIGISGKNVVEVYVSLRNDQKSNLGLPLPAGRVRLYKKDDADAQQEFLGEDVIYHTPKDESASFRVGNSFDVVGARKQTNYTSDLNNRVITESFEIALRNHRKEPVAVTIYEELYRSAQWEIQNNSDKFEKVDSSTISIPVEIAPDGEKKVTYTVKYTW